MRTLLVSRKWALLRWTVILYNKS